MPGLSWFHRRVPTIHITRNLQAHVPCPEMVVTGGTVRDAVEAYFQHHPRVRGYVFDEHGMLRKHMVMFVDGVPVRDRSKLSDPVQPDASIYIFQALSGG
jgi:sulfur-carrier protein